MCHCFYLKVNNLEIRVALTTCADYCVGTTILEYLTQLRLEKATTLMNNPEYTLDYIASQCGFKTSRQLQRIMKEKKPCWLSTSPEYGQKQVSGS